MYVQDIINKLTYTKSSYCGRMSGWKIQIECPVINRVGCTSTTHCTFSGIHLAGVFYKFIE